LLAERLAALTVAVLLILTALGSAWLMFAAALLGLTVFFLVLRGSLTRTSVLMAILAALIALVIAVMMSRI
jgi:hypothetical protein